MQSQHVTHFNRDRMSRGTARRPARGTASVETCAVLPFLMLLVLGTIDLGRYCYAHIATLSAARNAAFVGGRSSAASLDEQTIDRVAREEMVCVSGVSKSNPKCKTDVEVSNDRKYRKLTVRVEYKFKPVFPYPGLPRELVLLARSSTRVMPDAITGQTSR